MNHQKLILLAYQWSLILILAQPVILRRPKEYVANTKRHTWVDTDNEEPAFDWNELAPPTHLQRPNSFYPNDPISSF